MSDVSDALTESRREIARLRAELAAEQDIVRQYELTCAELQASVNSILSGER